ncbi:OmpA family protein [Nonomuraea lactucae]|uniref:OmpA family protein n=1 Tax=Nonomuraea lactucae TaxID=2249762 RepID=UPI001F05B45C|nr:OmpA family protein [Nonomuraea lactucae]
MAAALTVAPASAAPRAATPTPPADATGVVEDLVLPIEDVVGEVEFLDGTESESERGTQVTVALTSDVLFPLDKWALTPTARQRLRQVAGKVRAETAGGVVKIEGHTDDQGSDACNLTLSRRPAQAVERAVRGVLSGAGVTLQAGGYGESRPKFPNMVEGRPIEKNREKNRRVEIVFDVKQ